MAAKPKADLQTVVTDSHVEAAACIRRGGICAFPTETVFGLGADVFNEKAVDKIFEAKGRPSDNPLIAHIASVDQIDSLVSEITTSARLLMAAFFPGPLTLVLKKRHEVPDRATAGLSTIGVRMTSLPIANEFIRECGAPVVAPSANRSGRPSPTTWQAVLEDLNGRIDCLLRGPDAVIGIESTVVDCTGLAPVLLRAGSTTLEQLKTVVPEISVYRPTGAEGPKSPGLKHAHYAPHAQVVIVSGLSNFSDRSLSGAAFIGIDQPPRTFAHAKRCEDVDEYAREVFEFFRECDRRGIETIYCEAVPETGLGTALMDRLRRAEGAVN